MVGRQRKRYLQWRARIKGFCLREIVRICHFLIHIISRTPVSVTAMLLLLISTARCVSCPGWTVSTNIINLSDVRCVTCDSPFVADLSFVEERPRRSEALERHDGSSPHGCLPVAFPEGLRKPAIAVTTALVNTSLSAPHPSRPQSADNLCHLFVLRPLWYPLVRFWFSPNLLVQTWKKHLWCPRSLCSCARSLPVFFFFLFKGNYSLPLPCQTVVTRVLPFAFCQ